MRVTLPTIILALASVAANRTTFGPDPVRPRSNGQRCEVRARGKQQGDVPNILHAFRECNNGDTVVFPGGGTTGLHRDLTPY
jgi:galacturan 1,4-alpha-galacturonidase